MTRGIVRIIFCLCLICLPTISSAVDCTDTGQGCPPGCYTDGFDCSPCEFGTYSSDYDSQQCYDCYAPKGAVFDEFEGADNLYGCPWTLTCDKGEFFGMNSTYDVTGCQDCGSAYENNGFTMYWDGIGGYQTFVRFISPYSKDNVCQGKVFKLTLKKNTNVVWPGLETYTDKTAFYKYEEGFSGSNVATVWNPTKLPDSSLQPTGPVKVFKGYSIDANDCSDMGKNKKFDEKGNTNGNVRFESDTTLYACWLNNVVHVFYYDSEGSGTGDVMNTCEINDSTGEVSNCLAKEYSKTAPQGQFFIQYECKAGENADVDCGTVVAGDKIPLVDTLIHLYPVFGACPAGYYCNENGEKLPCPGGTTSGGNASSIDDCYVAGGSGGTRFCDNKGCFNLPSGIEIMRNPQ